MYYIRSDASNAVTYPSSSTTSTSNTRPRPTSKYQPPPRPLSLSSSPASSIPSLPPSSSSNTSNPFHLITPSSSHISLLSPPSSNKTRSTSYPFRTPISNPSCPPSPLRQRIPVKPSLALSVNLNPAAIFLTMTGLSRAHSPPRSMSPSRHDIIPRPSSRCESLLRDTLRRDEYKRSTSVARSRSGRRSRPRGNSFLGQLRQDEDADDDADTRSSTSSSLAYRRGSNDPFYISAPSAPRPFKGGFVGSPPEVDYFPSLSPSSPSPMPPTMHRTRTSPTVPLASSSNIGLEAPHHTRPKSHTVPQSPRASRQPLPGTSSTARRTPSVGPDTVDVPLNSRSAIVSPHEAVLRAKLESVLHRGASHVLVTRLEERGNVEQAPAGHPRSPRQRNHVRSHSQIVVPGQRNYGERISPTSPNVRVPRFMLTPIANSTFVQTDSGW